MRHGPCGGRRALTRGWLGCCHAHHGRAVAALLLLRVASLLLVLLRRRSLRGAARATADISDLRSSQHGPHPPRPGKPGTQQSAKRHTAAHSAAHAACAPTAQAADVACPALRRTANSPAPCPAPCTSNQLSAPHLGVAAQLEGALAAGRGHNVAGGAVGDEVAWQRQRAAAGGGANRGYGVPQARAGEIEHRVK